MSRQKLISIVIIGLLSAAVGCEDLEGGLGFDDNDKETRGNDVCSKSSGAGDCVPYEAEQRTAQSGTSVATNNAGYIGTGFVDFGGNGTWIEWNNINAPVAGEYTLTFRYANGSAGNRQAAVSVKGGASKNVPFPKTGSWTNWQTATTTLSLSKGTNTIVVTANTSKGGPNLDNMLVVGKGLDDGGTNGGNDGSNIALGKPTRQSSIDYRGDSARAVDGNTSGRWSDGSITHTASESQPWWRVDLGTAYSVQKVTLYNRTDCCSDRLSDFVVDLLGQNDQVIASKYHQGQAAAKTDLDISGSGVYSVRVALRRTNPLSLAEVQVFGSQGGGGYDKCAEADENKSASLTCPSGQKITSINFASYGLPTGSCAAGFQKDSCHATSSQSKVEAACLNNQSCTVPASNGNFGDPCSGKYKRIAIGYTCGGGGVSDQCPNDPNKTAPGICGCGQPDTDSDGDRVPNCNDNCPFDAKKTEPGKCGCGKLEGTCSGGSGSFSIGFLPDVQKLTMGNTEAEWLYKIGDFFSANKDIYNLKAVASVGDLVQVATLPGTRNQTRWDRVLNFAHDLRADNIHFIPACGNHDGCQDHYGDPLDYVAQFSDFSRSGGPDGSPRAYVLKRDNPYFLESYSTANSTHGVENAAFRIEFGGRAFLVLSLRFGDSTEDPTLTKIYNNWLGRVLDENEDALAIITTHWFQDSPAWISSAHPAVCDHDNVLMVVQGHSHGTRFRNVLDCGGGHKIENHQFSLPHGTDGLNEAAARIYTFDLDAGEVCFKTRHVYLNKWLTDKSGCDPAKDGHCDEACFDLPDR